jgi:hypothetical protein
VSSLHDFDDASGQIPFYNGLLDAISVEPFVVATRLLRNGLCFVPAAPVDTPFAPSPSHDYPAPSDVIAGFQALGKDEISNDFRTIASLPLLGPVSGAEVRFRKSVCALLKADAGFLCCNSAVPHTQGCLRRRRGRQLYLFLSEALISLRKRPSDQRSWRRYRTLGFAVI